MLRRPLELGQYLAIRYTERLAETGAVNSVGSKGDSYDNALAETIHGSCSPLRTGGACPAPTLCNPFR